MFLEKAGLGRHDNGHPQCLQSQRPSEKGERPWLEGDGIERRMGRGDYSPWQAYQFILPVSLPLSAATTRMRTTPAGFSPDALLSPSFPLSMNRAACPLNTAKLIGPNLWSSLPSRTDVRGFSFPLRSASPPGVSPVVHLLTSRYFSYLDRTHITPHQSSAWTIYWAHFWFVVVVATVLIVICGSQVWRF